MRLVEVIARPENVKGLPAIMAGLEITKFWPAGGNNDTSVYRILVDDDKTQVLLDTLQGILGPDGNIVLVSPEAVLPQDVPSVDDKKRDSESMTREELVMEVEKGARCSRNFLLLVTLSTFVASIGLLKDNVAVIIGAMVIAPLLGPNIALALSTALGDTKLLWAAVKANIIGLGLATGIAIIEGVLYPVSLNSKELLARTDVGLDSVALALASGMAAALSLTKGLSSVLVGVMVAVAILPPAATMGIMIGAGQFDHAFGAALLLAVNIVSVNLSAQIVFMFKGIKPRTWLGSEKAKESTVVSMVIWLVSLIFLVTVILTTKRIW